MFGPPPPFALTGGPGRSDPSWAHHIFGTLRILMEERVKHNHVAMVCMNSLQSVIIDRTVLGERSEHSFHHILCDNISLKKLECRKKTNRAVYCVVHLRDEKLGMIPPVNLVHRYS